jgi:hypothetical protein
VRLASPIAGPGSREGFLDEDREIFVHPLRPLIDILHDNAQNLVNR